MFRLARVLLVPWSLALASCGSGSAGDEGPSAQGPDRLADLQPVAALPGGVELFTPILRQIQPGQDITYCTYTDFVAKEEMRVHTVKGAQSAHGHHVIAFYAPVPHKAGTVECGSADMEGFRQLIGGTGGEGFTVWDPPENVVSVIPQGAQLVIQSHWINTTDKPIDAQAMITTVPGPNRDDLVVAGTTAFVSTDFRVQPHDTLEKTSECVVTEEQKLMLTIGHQHEWGKHVKVEVDRKGGGTEMLLDLPFKPLYVFEPPTNAYDLAKPLVLGVGDKVRVTCTWQNDTDQALEFPQEMCVFFGYSMNGKDAHCVNGEWDK